MNKFAHGIVLVFFGAACWLAWLTFKLPLMVRPGMELPAFTRLCIGVGPVLVISLAVLATAYCLWIWFRKRGNSWVAFLATATSALVFVMLPGVVAITLALITAINHLPAR